MDAIPNLIADISVAVAPILEVATSQTAVWTYILVACFAVEYICLRLTA